MVSHAALRLHAITLTDASPDLAASAENGVAATRIPFRDLSAVVSEQQAFALDEPSDAQLERHRAVVDSIFRQATVLPAPIGVVFRTPDVLTRWMELHYVSLTDALEFVEDRAAARVHVLPADGKTVALTGGSDMPATAKEAMRALRRRAVASVPLHHDRELTSLASTAFLVERQLWKEFEHEVAEQQDAHQHLKFDVTGPWAPYDFVRMQFGG